MKNKSRQPADSPTGYSVSQATNLPQLEVSWNNNINDIVYNTLRYTFGAGGVLVNLFVIAVVIGFSKMKNKV